MDSSVNMDAENVPETVDTSEMDGKYLTFYTAGQLFGVPISDVVQIVKMQEITPVPEYPYYAKGIIDLRGTVIPVVDIRIRLGKEEAAYDERTCIIIANIRERYFGFIVDEVNEVTSIPDEKLSPPPTVAGDISSSYLTGVGQLGEGLVLTIDTAKVFGEADLELLTQGVYV